MYHKSTNDTVFSISADTNNPLKIQFSYRPQAFSNFHTCKTNYRPIPIYISYRYGVYTAAALNIWAPWVSSNIWATWVSSNIWATWVSSNLWATWVSSNIWALWVNYNIWALWVNYNIWALFQEYIFHHFF